MQTQDCYNGSQVVYILPVKRWEIHRYMGKQEVPSRVLIPCAVLFAVTLDVDCALFGIKVLP